MMPRPLQAPLKPGSSVLEGAVQSVHSYGAFVAVDEPPGLVALLHVSQISGGRVDKTEAVLAVGERVKVRWGCPGVVR